MLANTRRFFGVRRKKSSCIQYDDFFLRSDGDGGGRGCEQMVFFLKVVLPSQGNIV